MRAFLAIALAAASVATSALASWTIQDGANPDAPGRKVDVQQDGKLVARFIYGEGQIKPFLHLFGTEGECLTEWSPDQQFPHHRGFFIGWNKIASDLGIYDLWHMKGGSRMTAVKIDTSEATEDSARLSATIEWRGGKADASGSDLLLTENRTLIISRPQPHRIQVEATFVLRAARDLALGGDLQHAGVHFRGSKELLTRKGETSYLWEPDLPGKTGKIESRELKWARLTFPVGQHWYSATLLNAPANPVEQLSWRDYGRFGFFFARELAKEESLTLRYRLLVKREEGLTAKPDAEKAAASRAEAQACHEEFARAARRP
jgi:hypothetical protein